MDWPDLNPPTPLPPPDVPWTIWLVGVALLLAAATLAVYFLRGKVQRRPLAVPPPDPAKRALQAMAAIPDDWATSKAAAAGARILRGYFAVHGLGPGVAHPASEFSGLRSAEAWHGLIDLLGEMESLACRPHPSRQAWLDARALALRSLDHSAAPAIPTTPANPP